LIRCPIAENKKKVAEQMGVQQYEVVSCPNDSDEFVKFLSELLGDF
jgi:protoheme ferro-lyase